MGELFRKRTAIKLAKLNTDPAYDVDWLKKSVGADYCVAKRLGREEDARAISSLMSIIKRMK